MWAGASSGEMNSVHLIYLFIYKWGWEGVSRTYQIHYDQINMRMLLNISLLHNVYKFLKKDLVVVFFIGWHRVRVAKNANVSHVKQNNLD